MEQITSLLTNQSTNVAKLRILSIQSDQFMQLAIEQVLTDNPELQLVGKAEDGYQGVEAAISLQPDLVILDVDLPHLDGITVAQKIQASLPLVKFLAFTANSEPNQILATLANGFSAYCLKGIRVKQLLAAITAASEGGIYLDPQIAHTVVDKLKPIAPKVNLDALSTRESEILKLIVEGKTNSEIGAELYLSPNTVKTHLRNIMNKLLVDDRVQVAVEALRSGLV